MRPCRVLVVDEIPFGQDFAQALTGAGLVVHGLAQLLMRDQISFNQNLAETGLFLLLIQGFHDIAFQNLRTVGLTQRDLFERQLTGFSEQGLALQFHC